MEFVGVLTTADAGSRRELRFDVPAGVAQIRVETDYTNRDQGTTLQIGVYDPQRFRGWGGNPKPSFTIGETFATPAFNPGPMVPGVWRLVLTAAHVRTGATSTYHIRVVFARATDVDEVAFVHGALNPAPGWYRGDLHTHTGHSDAACRSLAGKSVPCPAFLTLEAAVRAGLDFVAVTDHNVTSQFESLAELQPYFDAVLILPAREVTTSLGHFNLIGATGFVETDPRASGGGGDVNAVLKAAHATGGFVSLNHPATPTGEDCLGCGWTVPDTDYASVDGIEAVNGGTIGDAQGRPAALDAAVSAHIGFWQARLSQGLRLTGVGGGDNHDPIQARGGSPIGPQSEVGHPTTVVYARSLSQIEILDALRRGRVFIDLGEGRGRRLDLSARVGTDLAMMGDLLQVPANHTTITASIHVIGAAGGRIELLLDGRSVVLLPPTITKADQIFEAKLKIAHQNRWLRCNVYDAAGHLLLIGNPVYLRPA